MKPTCHGLAASLLLTTLGASVLAAPRTVAVSYFDNTSGSAELAPLSRGLADMLITDLTGLPSITIVERQKLNVALDELKLSKSKFIDPRNALRLGKGLAAELILTGSYAVIADTLRIDVRLFDVTTGAVLISEHVEGKQAEFFALEKELVELLVSALELKLTRNDKLKLRTNQTQSVLAWASYSAALEATDRGDADAARDLYRKALAADPAYAAARTALERLQAMFAKTDRETLELADAEIDALNPKAKDFGRRVDALLDRLSWEDLEQSRKKTSLLLWLGQRNLLTCAKKTGPAPSSPHVIISGVPAGGVISHCRQAHEVLLLAYRFLEDPTEGDHLVSICEKLIQRLPGDLALPKHRRPRGCRDEGEARREQRARGAENEGDHGCLFSTRGARSGHQVKP
jgi:TolB-like protein